MQTTPYAVGLSNQRVEETSGLKKIGDLSLVSGGDPARAAPLKVTKAKEAINPAQVRGANGFACTLQTRALCPNRQNSSCA
ncbi:MAG: hypothetical protein V4517_21100 [Pseudomonadota bacterium]